MHVLSQALELFLLLNNPNGKAILCHNVAHNVTNNKDVCLKATARDGFLFIDLDQSLPKIAALCPYGYIPLITSLVLAKKVPW